MNLRFVEAFIWVARLQSITRAAEKLRLTQSAVSRPVTRLEDELGVPLRVSAMPLLRQLALVTNLALWQPSLVGDQR